MSGKQYGTKKAGFKIHQPAVQSSSMMTQQKAQAQLKRTTPQQLQPQPQQAQQAMPQTPPTVLASPTRNPVQPSNEGGKSFAGWKAELMFNVPGLSISVPVRYATVKTKAILPHIRMEDSKGNEVEYRPDTEYHYGYFLVGTGQPISESEIRYFQVMDDGSKVSVLPFQRSKDFKIEKLLPRSQLEAYLPEKSYEMWSDNVPALAQTAEYLEKNDQVAVAKFSFGKFKAYYALIYPVMEQGNKFSLAMTMTTGKKVYDKEMDFNTAGFQQQFGPQGPQGVLGEL